MTERERRKKILENDFMFFDLLLLDYLLLKHESPEDIKGELEAMTEVLKEGE